MIEALYEIGKLQPEEDLLDEVIEDIGKGYKHVFKIVFVTNEVGVPVYEKIGYEEFSNDKKLKYFYKRGGSQGSDNTPTSKITLLTKTFESRMVKSIETFLNRNKNYFQIDLIDTDEVVKDFKEKAKMILEYLDKELKSKKELILVDLKTVANEYGCIKNEKEEISDGGVLTITLDGKYVGDTPSFRSPFTDSGDDASVKSSYEKYGTISKSKNKSCYICKQKKQEVFGFASTFQFYTVDKDGMITGGFNKNESWRNYPVCADCVKSLERGKKYIENSDNHLRLKFCGFNYFLIPQLILNDSELLSDILSRIKSRYSNFSLSAKESGIIVQLEEKVLEILSEECNLVNFNFVFFEEKQSGAVFNILLNLQEIAPSRMKFLIESKYKIDEEIRKYDIFSPVLITKSKKEIIEVKFDFTFYKIREFYINSNIEGNYDKDFLAIVNDIFIGKCIKLEFLLSRILDKVRRKWSNGENINFNILNAYKIILFIEEIKLLDRRRSIMTDERYPYEDFFNENPIMDSETKRAVFLEGVLAEKLLSIQYVERGAKPFMARLNGLKIDGKIAQRLLPEMINKLEQYKKNYYRDLESAISTYMLKAEFEKYTMDELSFYFTLGMTLSKKFLKEKENEEK